MKKNQKGFTLVEGLLILVAVLLIGGLGYYAYSQRSADTKAGETIQEAPSQKAPEESTQKYLDIPEAGVRLALTSAVEDAYYKVSKEGYIYFSTHYFDSLEGFKDCKADPTNNLYGLAALSRAKVGDDNFGSSRTETELEAFPNTKIDDTYYWIIGSQAYCWDYNTTPDSDPGVKKAQEVRAALTGLSSRIEKL